MLNASLSTASRAHYGRAWHNLSNFNNSLSMIPCLPAPTSMLLLFIAHLHASKFAPASIVSTVSAVWYFHKINGFTDPATSFLVIKLLAGAPNRGAVPDARLPVTLSVLGRLLSTIPVVFTSGYKCRMLYTMMVVTFRAYLRVGDDASISARHWQLFTAR